MRKPLFFNLFINMDVGGRVMTEGIQSRSIGREALLARTDSYTRSDMKRDHRSYDSPSFYSSEW